MRSVGPELAAALSGRSAQWLTTPLAGAKRTWLRQTHHPAVRPPAVSRPEQAQHPDASDNPNRWELQQLASEAGPESEGLQWLNETGRSLTDEADAQRAAMVQQEQSRQFLQQSSSMQSQALEATIDETGTVRQPYYKRLMAMAQAGQVADARTILDEMQSEGLAPGARAYHGLIYANVRAGDANGALLAIKEEYAAGVQPLPQSYAILIFAFMQEGLVREAQAVYASAVRAGVDKRPSWLMLTTQLFEHSEAPGDAAHKDAMYYLVAGLDEGMVPDADLYVHIIDSQPTWVDAQEKLSEMRDLQMLPEPRHINRVLKQMVQAGFPEKAEELVDAVYANPMAPFKPDIESYNEILEGLVACTDPTLPEDSPLRHNSPGPEGWADAFKGRLVQRRLTPNMRTHALLVEAHAWEGEEDNAMLHFNKLGIGQGYTLKLTDNGISTLLLLLSDMGGHPAYLLQVLQALDADNHVFNSELDALKDDHQGLSVFTRWLATRQVRLRHYAVRPRDGMTAAAEAIMIADADSDVLYVDDVAIGVGNCAIDEEGNILVPTSMSIEQLRAELVAKELPAEGKRAELLKRVQQSRKAAPASVQAVMRRQQALGAGADTEADSDDPDTVSPDDGTEVEGSGAALQALPPDTMVVSRGGNMNVLSVTRGIGFDHYAGVAVDIEAAEASGKDYLMLSRNGEDVALLLDSEGLEVLAKDDLGEDSEAKDIGGQKITDEEEDEEELRNVLSGFDASLLADAPDDDEEGSAAPLEEALGEDLAQFGDDADPEGDTDADMMAALEATRATALAEAQVMREANARAGVELALQMLPLWVRLGGGVSLADMRMLAKSAATEVNAVAAVQVARQLHLVESRASDNVMRQMYLQCCTTCLNGGDFEAVDEVYMAMLDAGHPPDPEFEKEFEVVQQLHRQNQVQQHLDDINGGM